MSNPTKIEMLRDYPTKELVEELRKREGVHAKDWALFQKIEIPGTGPTITLVVED